MTDDQLLVEMEDLLRTAPQLEMMQLYSHESTGWLGRASAALHQWDDVTSILNADSCIKILQGPGGGTDTAYRQFMLLLHRASNDLRMKTVGPLSEHIEAKKPFEYFTKIRKIVEEATSEVFFVDPYLDADFVLKYLPHVKPDVRVRLLTSEKVSKLVPSVQTFRAEYGIQVEIRKPQKTQKIHDRYVFIDGSACYHSGAVNAGVKTHHSPEQKYTTCYEAIPGVAGCPGSP